MDLSRLATLQKKLVNKKIDALFVANHYNLLYLTDFKGVSADEREGYLLVLQDQAYFITDGRYEVVARKHFEDTKVKVIIFSPEKRLSHWLQEIATDNKIKNTYFEKHDLKYSEYELLSKKLPLEGSEPLVEELRTIKDDGEVELIKDACRITDQSLNDVIKSVHLGITESQIAWNLEKWVKEKGYELAFAPIVAFGANTALPHYNPKSGNVRLKKNQLILIDYGVKYKDYCADITRMFFFGKPNDEVINTYNTLLKVQKDTIKYCSSVSRTRDIDIFARKSLKKKGLPNIPHSTGHGVGLFIHEGPAVSSKSKDTVKSGQVFTIEPGVYIPGKFGMRIEDTVYINERRQAVPFTKFPKELYIV